MRVVSSALKERLRWSGTRIVLFGMGEACPRATVDGLVSTAMPLLLETSLIEKLVQFF